MRTNTFIKALAFAMLLATACNKNEIANEENTEKKGFSFPVTVNVTREGDDATKATYTDNGNGTGSLGFSAGDKLFVNGKNTSAEAGFYAGTLDYVPATGNFSGTITTQYEYTGSADALFSSANYVFATLLPNGYESYGYFSPGGTGYGAYVDLNNAYTFATSKAAGVEQFSLEKATSYSSGFALSPQNAILNFTITGLTASTDVAVSLTGSGYTVTKTVTTDGEGNAVFATGIGGSCDLNDFSLTVGGNPITLVTESKTLTAGKIYNITRNAAPAPAATDLSTKDADYTASDGEILTGTLASNVKISIADGATVTLNNVSINASGSWTSGDYAGITCLGDATIILSGTNTVKGFCEDYPGIQAAAGKTLIINGTGSLTASSNGWGAGIGGGFCISCGNITITGGTITATGGENAAGIGGGQSCSCGDITITSGVTHVTATKGEGATNSIGAGVAGTCGTVTIEDSSKVTQN